MTDSRPGRLIDPVTEQWLVDDGLPGFTLAEVIDSKGNASLWLIDRDQLGIDGTDHGDEEPAHELLGALPAPWIGRIRAAPIRCGHRTRSGAPCRIPVASQGLPCGLHRNEARR